MYFITTEETERQSSEKPKKRRVTFGEALSPEIFDETLPANTPLWKGATPIRHPGLQSIDFDCSDVSPWVFQCAFCFGFFCFSYRNSLLISMNVQSWFNFFPGLLAFEKNSLKC